MIKMRSSPNNKITKPPPPVPPRPNKNVVAEALAKTRKPLPDQPENGTAPTPSVTRSRTTIAAAVKSNLDAMPHVMVKTQTYYPVNYCNIKSKQDDPPSSAASYESPKPTARTIIYQSNVTTTVVNSAKVNNTPKESLPINGCIVNNNSELKNSSNTGASISRTNSLKTKSSGSQHFEITASSNSIHCSENSTPEELPMTTNGSNSINGNWTDILNDRNHVNTLIDEMFASVLDQPSETSDVIQTVNDNVITCLPYRNDDTPILSSDAATTITISDEINCRNGTTPVESCNGSPVDMKKVVTFQEESSAESSTSTQERKHLRNDRQNHEQLIAELANMKHEKSINKRQRKPSRNASSDEDIAHRRIQHSDWVEVTKTGQEVRLSSCQITIDEETSGVVHKNNVNNLKLSGPDEGEDSSVDSVISRCTNMSSGGNMSLQGLPPLPKSLSGFSIMMEANNLQGRQTTANIPHMAYPPHPKTPSTVLSNGTTDSGSLKKESSLDSKLALLRREMYSLRQLDLSLLSQLWSLNESIQDFRHMLQENEDRGGMTLSPPSPSPTPSSAGDEGHDGAAPLEDNDDEEDDIEDEDDDSAAPFFTPRPMRYRPAPPPPPSNVASSAASSVHHRRTSNSSSGTSSV